MLARRNIADSLQDVCLGGEEAGDEQECPIDDLDVADGIGCTRILVLPEVNGLLDEIVADLEAVFHRDRNAADTDGKLENLNAWDLLVSHKYWCQRGRFEPDDGLAVPVVVDGEGLLKGQGGFARAILDEKRVILNLIIVGQQRDGEAADLCISLNAIGRLVLAVFCALIGLLGTFGEIVL